MNGFVPYQESKQLKEIGFHEPCVAKYIGKNFQHNTLGQWNNYNDGSYGLNVISAPLFQQIFLWFREKYRMQCNIYIGTSGKYSVDIWGWVDGAKGWEIKERLTSFFITYEESELQGLCKLIEHVK